MEISVGRETISIGSRKYEPLSLDLPAGVHDLTMSQGGEVLYRETFVLEGGDELVLTAWAQTSAGPAPQENRGGPERRACKP